MPQPILIEFVTNLDAVNNAIDALEELGVVDKQTADSFRKTSAAVKEHNAELDKTGKSVGAVKLQVQDFVDAIKKIPEKMVDEQHKKGLEEFGKTVDGTTAKISSLKSQLTSLKNALATMAAEGKQDTEEFEAMTNQTVALQKQIDDTSKRIRILSSDFKAMDTVLSISSGVAGGFAAAQGSMALFGVESEDLQKTMLKVQASLALVNGLTAIQATLDKNSAAAIGLKSAAQKIYNYFVDETTKKMILARVATAGFLTLGIAAAVIAISYAYNKWKESVEDTRESQERLKKVSDAAVDIYSEEVAKLTALIKIVKDENSTNQEKEGVLKTVNKEYADQIGKFNDIEDLEKRFIERASSYIEVLKLKAQAQASMNLATEEYEKKLKATSQKEIEQQELVDNMTSKWFKFNTVLTQGTNLMGDVGAIKEQEKAIQSSTKSFDKYIDLYNQFIADAKKLSEDNNFDAPGDMGLRNAKALADARVLLTKAGTEEELKAKIAALEAERKLALYNSNLTAGERYLIQVKYQKDVAMLEQAYHTQTLKDAQDVISAKLQAQTIGAEEEYQLKLNLLATQREAELNNMNLTESQKLKINADFDKRARDLEKDHRLQLLSIEKTQIEAGIELQRKGSEGEFMLKKHLLMLERDERIIQATSTITNEEELAAELLKINADYVVGLRDLNTDKLQNDLDTINKRLIAELAYKNALLQLEGAKMGDSQMFREIELQSDIELKQKQLDLGKEFYQNQFDNGIISQEEYNTKILELQTALVEAEISLEEYKIDRKKVLNDAYREAFEQTILNSFEFGQTLINNEIQNLDGQLKRKQISQLDYERKVANERAKQAKINKLISAAQTVIHTSESIIKTNATLGLPAAIPFDIIAGVMGAQQLALILAQDIPEYVPSFLKGVENLTGGEPGRDSILAMLAPGERVVPPDVNSDYFPILSAIHHRDISPELLNAIAEMPDFTSLLGGLGIVPSGNGFEFDYDKLGKAVGKEIQKIPINNMNLDAEGFTRYVMNGNNRTKYYEDRYSSN